MRLAVVAFVLALLLPTPLAHGGSSGIPAPSPLGFFGGEGPAEWTAPALITEVYYNTLRADEYVVLANLGNAPLEVAGWVLTDGEGRLEFPQASTFPAGARVVVAQNSTAYFEDTLHPADFQYRGGNATSMLRSGSFLLNNAGDEVILRDAAGQTVDAFVYGTSPYAGEGWSGPPAATVDRGLVARRGYEGGSAQDGNGSVDWDLVRVWSLGQSDFPSTSFTFTGKALAFISPDDSLEPLRFLIAQATKTIDASLYTFTSAPLAEALQVALGRGVRVRILLEGAPVGGIPADEWDLVQSLARDRAVVRFMVDNTSLDIQERYRYLHAKYAILDGETVVVSSENWGRSGFPEGGVRGSRGWSIAVTHPPLAAYFTGVFEEDFDSRWRDMLPVAEMVVTPSAPKPPETEPFERTFGPRSFTGPFRVVPVLGPDTTLAPETILGAIRSATRSIHAELFYAHTVWGPFHNGYLTELVGAAQRGVEVRVLLDSSPFNVDENDPIDNDDTVAYLNEVAAAQGLNLEAKVADLSVHELSAVHNKGLLVDGRSVLVSSINWNRNSPTANREAGLLVENEAMAAYFEDVFAWDWKDDFTRPVADAGADRNVEVGTPVTFNGLASWDDAGIANFSWDLDGDGAFDAWGPEVTFVYRQAGTFVVRLRVADASGNVAEDTATVSVQARSEAATPVWPFLILAIIATVAVLWFLLARRGRKGINKPPNM